jgi:hypothetical protein
LKRHACHQCLRFVRHQIRGQRGKINAFLPVLDGMMGGGLVTLEKVKVLYYCSGPETAT